MQSGPTTVSLFWRYLGSAIDDDPATLYASERFGAVNYFDATLAFQVNEHFTMRTGVSNVFDKKPLLAASTQNGGNGEQTNTFPTFYDALGRSLFVSAKVNF